MQLLKKHWFVYSVNSETICTLSHRNKKKVNNKLRNALDLEMPSHKIEDSLPFRNPFTIPHAKKTKQSEQFRKNKIVPLLQLGNRVRRGRDTYWFAASCGSYLSPGTPFPVHRATDRAPCTSPASRWPHHPTSPSAPRPGRHRDKVSERRRPPRSSRLRYRNSPKRKKTNARDRFGPVPRVTNRSQEKNYIAIARIHREREKQLSAEIESCVVEEHVTPIFPGSQPIDQRSYNVIQFNEFLLVDLLVACLRNSVNSNFYY